MRHHSRRATPLYAWLTLAALVPSARGQSGQLAIDELRTVPSRLGLAVTPYDVVMTAETQIRIGQKNGFAGPTNYLDQPLFPYSLGFFQFNSNEIPAIIYPRTIYDHLGGRVIVAALVIQPRTLTSNGERRLYLAVSDTSAPSIDPGTAFTDWSKWRIDATVVLGSVPNETLYGPDYLGLGVTNDKIICTVIDYKADDLRPSSQNLYGQSIYVFDKSALYASNPPSTLVEGTHYVHIHEQPLPTQDAFYMYQPSLNYDDTEQGLLVGVGAPSGPGVYTTLKVRQVFGNPKYGTAGIGPVYTVTVPTPFDPNFAPAGAAAPVRGGPPLDTLDGRIQNVVLRNNRLYACQTNLNHFLSPPRYTVLWHIINAQLLQLSESGEVDPGFAPGGAVRNAFYPSINVNVQNDIGIGFNFSSTEDWASIGWVERSGSDPCPGPMSPMIVKEGRGVAYTSGAHAQPPRAGVLWGDHTASAIDPLDPIRIWHLAPGVVQGPRRPNTIDHWVGYVTKNVVAPRAAWSVQALSLANPGTYGVPAISLSAQPILGTTPTVAVTSSTGGPTPGVVFFGSPANLTISPPFDPHIRFLVDPSTPVAVSGVAPFSIPFPIANDPLFVGASLYAHSMMADASAIGSLSTTGRLCMFFQ